VLEEVRARRVREAVHPETVRARQRSRGKAFRRRGSPPERPLARVAS
jgi:hypothetical protein